MTCLEGGKLCGTARSIVQQEVGQFIDRHTRTIVYGVLAQQEAQVPSTFSDLQREG
jgi:hypothetical protein